MRRVAIIGTGGTIASTVDPDTGAAVTAIAAADLLDQVPTLADVADITSTDFAQVNSWDLTPALAADVAREATDAFDGGADGVVVTHGTDTMEETAFVLELLLGQGTAAATEATPRTVVCTGAMRTASADGPDGPRNLLAAVRVAADPACAALGGVVVLDDQVHAARHATKTHTTALGTFRSPDTGPLGTIDDTGVVLRWRPAPLPPVPGTKPAADVPLVVMASGMDDLLLRATLDAGSSGVVVVGSGSGNVPATWQPAIRELLDRDVPVVLASRCGAGRVTPTYGGGGGGHTLVGFGAIPAGDLSGPKARLALQFLLGGGATTADVRAWFADLHRPPPQRAR